MTNYSEEGKAATKVERILKVARYAFVDAIDSLGCIDVLEAGNQPDIIQSLKVANTHRAADLIQRALFGRVLMQVMTAFDLERSSGDFHLRVGMELLAEEIPRLTLCQRKDANRADIEAAERQWAECLSFGPLESLRIYRNKLVAHLSDYPANMEMPVVQQIFDLARMTAKVAELLAHGTGVAGVSLESQVTPFRESSRAFWEKWKQSD
jgi:hypothetical protein